MSRKSIFAAIRNERGRGFRTSEVNAIDDLLDTLGVPADGGDRDVSDEGIKLMHKWEGCELKAYPDPGSRDGKPWTIGWGATGPGIGPGVVWTQEQADDRFRHDLEKYEDEVEKFIGDSPTSQLQFDALVSFHYNTGAIAKSTLGRLHKAGDFEEAAKQFRVWVLNDGRKMKGLVNRRADEEALYRRGS